MFGKRPRIKAGVFLGGIRIHLTADRVHLFRDLLRGARCASLEKHMLQKVRDPARLPRFVRRACRNPDAERRRPQRIHRLQPDLQPVFQRNQFPRHKNIPFNPEKKSHKHFAMLV